MRCGSCGQERLAQRLCPGHMQFISTHLFITPQEVWTIGLPVSGVTSRS